MSTINDPINHPTHYTSHPSGVECIQIVEHLSFNIGNAIKCLWRAGLKIDSDRLNKIRTQKQHSDLVLQHTINDLEKAAWYINREIQRLGKGSNSR